MNKKQDQAQQIWAGMVDNDGPMDKMNDAFLHVCECLGIDPEDYDWGLVVEPKQP